MPEIAPQLLQEALSNLTKALDVSELETYAADPASLRVYSYQWFHKDAPELERHVGNIFASHTDEDRVHFAETYADSVLAMTGLEDAIWFRKGVWKREALPSTLYPRHRDHSVHTFHNYLLGWFLFTYSDPLREQFREAFAARGIATDPESFILRFGEVWCFASLLHDVGYLFEGQIPDHSMALIDEGIRAGATWIGEYFQHRFWEECGLRRADERRMIRQLANLDAEGPGEAGAGIMADYLRHLGSLKSLEDRIALEDGIRVTLPSDAFALWIENYRYFRQPSMAERIQRLENNFYALMEDGIPRTGIRVMDHGVCSGLLLLKYSTEWFKLLFSLMSSGPGASNLQDRLRTRVLSHIEKEGRLEYRGSHWWSSVVWATAATGLHNLQQNDNWAGAKPLSVSEDPLAYLGILVDIVEEWDRPSARRVATVETDRRRVNSGDVRISVSDQGMIRIEYGCRDAVAAEREVKMKSDLDSSLCDWRDIIQFSFVSR